MNNVAAAARRTRKACLNCYQRKVRCDYSVEAATCVQCAKHGLQCVLLSPTPPSRRTSLRDTLNEVTSRVRELESRPVVSPPAAQPSSLSESFTFLEPTGQPPDIDTSYFNLRQDPPPLDEPLPNLTVDVDASPGSGDGSGTSKVTTFHGSTSPWTALVTGTSATETDVDFLGFHDTATRIADEQKSTNLPQDQIRYDLAGEFPNLTADQIYEYAAKYASEAPFPIVCWPELSAAIERLFHTHRIARWGQLVCILLYIAFGTAHSGCPNARKNCKPFFDKAFSLLPQLLMEHDLWALKGMTLLVHYLQGGSQPEPCYALLGTASRMAIALGFHRKNPEGVYTAVEREEGKRAWWLCYVVERTFAIVFGRPGVIVDVNFDGTLPNPFSEALAVDHPEKLPTPPDLNDEDAAGFFRDMIALCHRRDAILKDLASHSPAQTPSTLFDLPPHLKSSLEDPDSIEPGPATPMTLRRTISDLCHYNTLIVIDRLLHPTGSPGPESLLCSRITIESIVANQEHGMIMCLWMWLYYAFSAQTMLFLHILHHPLAEDAMLYLALLSDLERVTGKLAFSEGALRVSAAAREMGNVGLEAVKRAAKRRAKGKRKGSTVVVSPEEQREAQRRRVDSGEGTANRDLSVPTMAEGVSDQIGSAAEGWKEFPPNFAWDDWDEWLSGGSMI